MEVNLNIPKMVSPAYYPLFTSKARYLAYKGSRGSGKSVAADFKVIIDIITKPYVNWLVVRQYFGTHKDSTFAGIKSAAYDMGVGDLFKFTTSPLEITYKPTGQKVFFRGMDDPLKITSIRATTGNLCRVFYEEAYELKSLDAFQTVEESIRGKLDDPNGFYQSILMFNPWSDKHWLKSEFFDEETKRKNSRSFTTTYKDNDHLDDEYIASLEEMRIRNPNRARVAVDGEWGIAEGLVFEGLFEQQDFTMESIATFPKSVGLDFGFKHDPTAGEFFAIDQDKRIVYIYDEFYKQGMLTEQIAESLKTHGSIGKKIIADSAEQRLIQELSMHAVGNIMPAHKGRDSVEQGVQMMQSYRFVVHPRVKGLWEELNTYVYDRDKEGNWLNKPQDLNNHAIDALRYGMEPYAFMKNNQYMSRSDRAEMIKNLGI
ncbi:PBSX family phage terminase large subunit [Weissella minor]|uniref:Phage terminase, large subunit, PBSX family n=1 Tax=Weissella minor TaxID=1620 RepID=A0A0R2JJ18_9LACO|nr:PBSX family phage terminase large subunit [Weissella minor]KRN77256.1 phage terminase, large subunit, PBSX family [Weissella minor]